MNTDPKAYPNTYEGIEPSQNAMRQTLIHVFRWMGLGLLLSAAVAYFASTSTAIWRLIYSMPWLPIVVVIAQLAIAFFFSSRLRRMELGAARISFVVYAVLTGFTFAIILTTYTSATIFLAFLLAALTFGAMAIYGAKTKRDLSSIGSVGYSLLFAVIIVSLLNLVLYFVAPGIAQGIDYILNYVVVALFIGITAWDMQKIKRMVAASTTGGNLGGETQAISLEAIGLYGAFMLYLDFINLFIRILRILGYSSRRN